MIYLLQQGGWEIDETAREAACREALEEAGVRGTLNVSIKIEPCCVIWKFVTRIFLDAEERILDVIICCILQPLCMCCDSCLSNNFNISLLMPKLLFSLVLDNHDKLTLFR